MREHDQAISLSPHTCCPGSLYILKELGSDVVLMVATAVVGPRRYGTSIGVVDELAALVRAVRMQVVCIPNAQQYSAWIRMLAQNKVDDHNLREQPAL